MRNSLIARDALLAGVEKRMSDNRLVARRAAANMPRS
jgi:hypothetical protein